MVIRKSLESAKNGKNSVFRAFLCGFRSVNLVLAAGALPLDPAGAMPPGPPVVADISRGKSDPLMRPGVAAGMECLCIKDTWSRCWL